MMYAYRPCTSLPKVNLFITVLGGCFLKKVKGEFFFRKLLKSATPLSCAGLHFNRKTYFYSILQSNISSLINGSEKTE